MRDRDRTFRIVWLAERAEYVVYLEGTPRADGYFATDIVDAWDTAVAMGAMIIKLCKTSGRRHRKSLAVIAA